MRDDIDPYKVLGVERTGSQDEIEAAYRERVLKYHPDRGGDAWAFQQVQAAYEKIKSLRKTPAEPQQPRTPTNAPQTPGASKTKRPRSASRTAGVKTTNAARRASSAYSSKLAVAAKAEQRRATAWFVGIMIVLFLIVVPFMIRRSDNRNLVKEEVSTGDELAVIASSAVAEQVMHADKSNPSVMAEKTKTERDEDRIEYIEPNRKVEEYSIADRAAHSNLIFEEPKTAEDSHFPAPGYRAAQDAVQRTLTEEKEREAFVASHEDCVDISHIDNLSEILKKMESKRYSKKEFFETFGPPEWTAGGNYDMLIYRLPPNKYQINRIILFSVSLRLA